MLRAQQDYLNGGVAITLQEQTPSLTERLLRSRGQVFRAAFGGGPDSGRGKGATPRGAE